MREQHNVPVPGRVSAYLVVVGHVNLADQLVQNELRILYKAGQTVIFLSLLFVPG